jgi:hypothetical protein
MSSVKTPVVPALAVRTVVANPGATPAEVALPPGGILEFTNHSPNFPTFEIQFVGPSPASPGDVLTGTTNVIVHVATTGTFHYKIRHIPPQGPDKVSGTFAVRSCIGC